MKKHRERLAYLLFAFCILDVIDFKHLGFLDICVLVTGGILAALKIYDFIGGSRNE